MGIVTVITHVAGQGGYRHESKKLGGMLGGLLRAGHYFEHQFLQTFASCDIDNMIQQATTHPAITVCWVNDYTYFSDVLTCSSPAVM